MGTRMRRPLAPHPGGIHVPRSRPMSSVSFHREPISARPALPFRPRRAVTAEPRFRAARTFATIAALLPSALRTIKTPTKDAFLWCLSCSAFAFFLFSFQVHEKSALLPLLPATLLSLRAPTLAARLPLAVCFSCYPLLERDGLSLAYVGVMGAFASVIGGGAPPPPP